MTQSNDHIVILGAGAIGCYLGTIWADAGCSVTLLGRQSILNLHATGLNLSNGISIPAATLDENPKLSHDPSVLHSASLIVVTVKSTALPATIKDIERHAAAQTPILCLLNGIKPTRDLRRAFPNRQIAAGMVPYNVVWKDAATLQRSSVGDVIVERTPTTETLHALLNSATEPIQMSDTISAVQHGKLLLNLNNPINALSGKTLYHQLRERLFRRAYAAVLSEAITVLKAANIPHAQSGPLPATKIVKMLQMPNWFFNTLVLPRQKLDPNSQTSMAQDLAAGKPTEIATINGEICHIAQTAGISAPINTKLVQLIKVAEIGGAKTFSGTALCKELGL
jgi:2-dehydropantoate 2-reductase